MSRVTSKPRTLDSSTFEPDRFFEIWPSGDGQKLLHTNEFRKSILKAFGLDLRDAYVYRAVAEVTLLQAQTHVDFGGQGGLHAWYPDNGHEARSPPTASDIAAYTDVFRPTMHAHKALNALAANAKKGSVRADVAAHLLGLYAPPDASRNLTVNRSKNHINPYFDVWAWSNHNLEWAGPEERTAQVRISHAVLPVLYHHFGCVCPSYAALSYIQQVARGRAVLDCGSGNGYWTYLLRRFESSPKRKIGVTAVDNGQSEWRTMWIGDTVNADAQRWLHANAGAKDHVLLLVYPVVGNQFTAQVLNAYRGTTIVCAGAQNKSGFTAFADETIADWIAREMPDWEKVLQIPLPSFAAKDEALFIFEKKV